MIFDYLLGGFSRYRRWRGGYWELERHFEFGCYWARYDDFSTRYGAQWRWYCRVIAREDHSVPWRALPASGESFDRAEELAAWNGSKVQGSPYPYFTIAKAAYSRYEIVKMFPYVAEADDFELCTRVRELEAWHDNADQRGSAYPPTLPLEASESF